MPATQTSTTRKKVIAISGSTRAGSANAQLISAMTELAAEQLELIPFYGIADLPHFNPDLDNDTPPAAVSAFRQLLREAGGILICTPEYAMGVPGTLKNAIDWTVSSSEFSHKPTALITASSVGQKGHAALMETLLIIEAKITSETQLIIPHVKTKVSSEGKITNTATLAEVKQVLAAFSKLLAAN